MDEEAASRLCGLVREILERATGRPDTSLEGCAPVPGAPKSNYYRLYWVAVQDPDNMPELVELECPFDLHVEWVPRFIMEAARRIDGLLCLRTNDSYEFESDGYFAFGTKIDADNAFRCLSGEAKDMVSPRSEYGYIEFEIWLCEPASFAAPVTIGMGQRLEGVQFMRHREFIN